MLATNLELKYYSRANGRRTTSTYITNSLGDEYLWSGYLASLDIPVALIPGSQYLHSKSHYYIFPISKVVRISIGAKSKESRKLFARNVNAMLDTTGADGELKSMFS